MERRTLALRRFRQLDAKLTTLKAEHREALKTLQKTCGHPVRVECVYAPSSFGEASPPMRVCVDCGIWEEGWGCGYKVLRSPHEYTPEIHNHIKIVSRDKVYRLRRFA